MGQIILKSQNSSETIEKVLKQVNSKKYMLVCDNSFEFIYFKNFTDKAGIPFVKFDGFTSNPLYEDICKGVDLFNSEACDTILAIGGGSTLDVAKCIKLFAKMNGKELYLQQDYSDSGIPLIAIPTTAGTGSESTRYAVIYYKGQKQSVTHESIIPQYAILDSAVLKTLPLYQKKCTVLDALCQGIESWWSVNSTPDSRKISETAVKLIAENINGYIYENSEAAAEKIMNAANLAGQAINTTQTTAAHAMSYKLTSMYKIPHGHAVAICLPEVWLHMLNNKDKCADSRGYEYLSDILEEISAALFKTDAFGAVTEFKKMLDKMGIEYPVSANRKDDIETLVNSVNIIRLSNNPVAPDREDIRQMYERILRS